jgi:hypothetical protein
MAAAIRKNLDTVQSNKQKQSEQAHLVLDQILSCLKPIQHRQESSAVMLNDLSRRYQSISQSIGEIVSALQFHDITRQRIGGEAKKRMLLPFFRTLAKPNYTISRAPKDIQFAQCISETCRLLVDISTGIVG